MKKMNYLYMILMFSAMFVSCNKKADRLLEQIENIVEQQPDSALILLDSVTEPYSVFSQKQYAIYKLLKIRAKDLTGEDIYNDIDGLSSSAYCFKPNSRYMALTELYFGKIYQLQKNNDKALKFFLKAETTSEKLDDDNLKGQIYYFTGDCYYEKLSCDTAIFKLKLSLQHFNKLQDNHKKKIKALNLIGNCFLVKTKTDSAMKYYNRALKLAEDSNDSVQQATVKQNLGITYLTLNQPEAAKQQLIQALELNPEHDKIYLSLAKVYGEKQLIDSAVYFAGLSLKSFRDKKDISALSSNYIILADLEEKNGNYKNALYNYKLYHTYLLRIQSDITAHKILEVEKTGKTELSETESSMNLRYYITVSLFSLTVIILLIIIFRVSRRNNRNKIEQQQKDVDLNGKNEELAVMRQRLYEQDGKITELKQKTAEMQQERDEMQQERDEQNNRIAEQDNRIAERDNKIAEIQKESDEKADLLNETQTELDEEKKQIKVFQTTLTKICKNVYDLANEMSGKNPDTKKYLNDYMNNLKSKSEMWNTVNSICKSSFEKIRDKYPTLTETEFRIACFTYMGFAEKVIALTLNLEDSTVRHHSSNIRDKLTMKKGCDIREFIDRDLKGDDGKKP